MNPLLALAARWREEAGLLRGYGASEAAATAELHAQQVIEAVKRAEDEELTLEEAATASGFARRTLRGKVASGEIPNVGRKGAPRIRRGDLPVQARSKKGSDFDASAEASSILGAGR